MYPLDTKHRTQTSGESLGVVGVVPIGEQDAMIGQAPGIDGGDCMLFHSHVYSKLANRTNDRIRAVRPSGGRHYSCLGVRSGKYCATPAASASCLLGGFAGIIKNYLYAAHRPLKVVIINFLYADYFDLVLAAGIAHIYKLNSSDPDSTY